MDYTLSSAGRGSPCHHPPASMDSFHLFNSTQKPLTCDGNTGWCSNLPGFTPFYSSMDLMEQNSALFLESEVDAISNVGVLRFPSDELRQMHDIGSTFNPEPVENLLTDKLILVLSLFKEFFRGGILAQIWLPTKQKNHYILSTIDQPYFLDNALAGYREVSKGFTFSTEGKPGTYLGLPGRVYLSRMPEWTSNVVYYNESEYLRVNHAVLHHVHGSVALPVFDSFDMSCCAVLELVTTRENPDFISDIEKVGQALQVANLKTLVRPLFHQERLSQNQKMAFAEIHDVLQTVCRMHKLPLALTWIPCSCPEDSNGVKRVCGYSMSVSSDDKRMLCIEESACFVHDKELEGFVHICAEHCLDEMQGIIGRVLQSNRPFFSIDVKSYDIREYPVVHHARRFGLTAVLAIRARSVWTGDGDYVLELFFPINLAESSKQKALLDNVLSTINSIYKVQSMALNEKSSGLKGSSADVLFSSNTNQMRDATSVGSSGIIERKIQERKRNVEKDVNMSTLQKYFSGSLKDAAKYIGVCPTTLKRICRKHGIMRWPSRKISKLNSSLRKIQTVLESVHGIEGLKFDLPARQLTSCKQDIFAAKSEKDDPGRVEEIADGTVATCSDAQISYVMAEMAGSSSSQSQNFEQSGLKITVKATYKEDTVRFKFVISTGCGKLYKEVGRRFKLEVGCFQLKYLDDEQEWVILASDADLEECAEVLANVGATNARFVVHELG